MGKVIAVVSGKGGVGKTTVTTNIGASLALMGKQVVILDADIGLRNLDVALGMENRIVYDWVDVIEGICKVRQALIKDKRFENLYLMSSSQTRDKNTINPIQMKVLCKKLKEKFDYIIIDSPPGIENGYRNSIEGADSVIVVTTSEIAAVRDAEKIIRDLERRENVKIMIVLNKIRSKLIRKGILPEIDYIIRTLKHNPIGIIKEDDSIYVSMNCGTPIASQIDSEYETIFHEMAARITGEEIPLFSK